MIMVTPTTGLVPSKQVVDQQAYASEHRGTGPMLAGNGTQCQPREDERHDEQASNKHEVRSNLVRD
jgi:hypothetical protein